MIRFVLTLALCTLMLYGLGALLRANGHLAILPTFALETTVLLFLSTTLIYYYLTHRAKGAFVQLYLLSMVLKLLAYGVYNVVVILEDSENAGLNVGFFMLLYVLFTTIELAFLYRKISS